MFEPPVSVAAVQSSAGACVGETIVGLPGCPGAVGSNVIARALVAALWLPARSTALTVYDCAPVVASALSV